MIQLNRFETFALGVSAAALAVGFVGVGKLVIAGITVAVVSYLYRRFVF
jgi:hypothetical protein